LGVSFVVSLAMLAGSGLLYVWMMARVPLLPLSDPLLMDSLKDNEAL
jgi:hypothetical protein